MHAVEKIGNLMKERHQIYNQVTELILRIKRRRTMNRAPPSSIQRLWLSCGQDPDPL